MAVHKRLSLVAQSGYRSHGRIDRSGSRSKKLSHIGRSRGGDRRSKPLRIVVTAGPTREYFDPVRFVSNSSSGKMGYAIAEAAAAAGHHVVLVSGPVSLAAPSGVKLVPVVSAVEMAAAAKRAFKKADAAVLVAAVCDYRPKSCATRKIHKTSRPLRVMLEPTEDIAASLGRVKDRRITVCFALEDHAGRDHAERKMAAKRCDAIVLNGPASIGCERASVDLLVQGERWRRWLPASKRVIAKRLVGLLEGMAIRW